MIIGVSGTRAGATMHQKCILRHLLSADSITGLLHGGCYGVDEEADALFREVRSGPPFAPIDIWPAIGGLWTGPDPENMHQEMDPLARNHVIVRDSELMLIVPRQFTEIRRSGTWATYRYAVKARRMTLVIRPDGSVRPATLALKHGVE